MSDNYCRSGRHKLTGDNVLIKSDGKRRCRTCFNETRQLKRQAGKFVNKETLEPEVDILQMRNWELVQQLKTTKTIDRVLEIRSSVLQVELTKAERVLQYRKEKLEQIVAEKKNVAAKRALLEQVKLERLKSITTTYVNEMGYSQERAEQLAAKQFEEN
jgi:hypothetical protein